MCGNINQDYEMGSALLESDNLAIVVLALGYLPAGYAIKALWDKCGSLTAEFALERKEHSLERDAFYQRQAKSNELIRSLGDKISIVSERFNDLIHAIKEK
jgi:hypothetical protein